MVISFAQPNQTTALRLRRLPGQFLCQQRSLRVSRSGRKMGKRDAGASAHRSCHIRSDFLQSTNRASAGYCDVIWRLYSAGRPYRHLSFGGECARFHAFERGPTPSRRPCRGGVEEAAKILRKAHSATLFLWSLNRLSSPWFQGLPATHQGLRTVWHRHPSLGRRLVLL
jgi:hypothetical protein